MRHVPSLLSLNSSPKQTTLALSLEHRDAPASPGFCVHCRFGARKLVGRPLGRSPMSLDPEKAVGVRAKFLGQLTSENRTTLSVIEHALDDQLDFTPHPKLRPFGALALHIYQAGI